MSDLNEIIAEAVKSGVKEAFDEALDQYDGNTIRHAVASAMPYSDMILGAIYSGTHDAVQEAIESGALTP